MDREEIEDILTDLVCAARRQRAAEIDAACCQTDRDYRKLREMNDAFDEARELAVMKLGALVNREADRARKGIT